MQSHNAKTAVQSSPAGLRPLSASAPIPAAPAKSSLEGWSSGVPSAQPDRRHESADEKTPTVFSFFEKATSTWQYVVADMKTLHAVIIDPVLDYDPASGNLTTKTADGLLGFVKDHGLNITHILYVAPSPSQGARPFIGVFPDLACSTSNRTDLVPFVFCSETHAHADHLTSSQYLKKQLGGGVPVCIGARITQVQQTFAPMYGFDDPALFEDTFDIYLQDEQELHLGGLTCRVVHLPGHTPDHVGYVFGSAIFTGDSIFNVRAPSSPLRPARMTSAYLLHPAHPLLPHCTAGRRFGAR